MNQGRSLELSSWRWCWRTIASQCYKVCIHKRYRVSEWVSEWVSERLCVIWTYEWGACSVSWSRGICWTRRTNTLELSGQHWGPNPTSSQEYHLSGWEEMWEGDAIEVSGWEEMWEGDAIEVSGWEGPIRIEILFSLSDFSIWMNPGRTYMDTDLYLYP